jgi:hypothetical protein
VLGLKVHTNTSTRRLFRTFLSLKGTIWDAEGLQQTLLALVRAQNESLTTGQVLLPSKFWSPFAFVKSSYYWFKDAGNIVSTQERGIDGKSWYGHFRLFVRLVIPGRIISPFDGIPQDPFSYVRFYQIYYFSGQFYWILKSTYKSCVIIQFEWTMKHSNALEVYNGSR